MKLPGCSPAVASPSCMAADLEDVGSLLISWSGYGSLAVRSLPIVAAVETGS